MSSVKPLCRAMTDMELEEFLGIEVTGRLALAVDNEPYIVPLAYVYMDNKIYVHWFKEDGQKAKMLAQNTRVCFEIDTYSQDHLDRQSVIIKGNAVKVTDKNTIKSFMLELAKKYPDFAPGKVGNHPEAVKLILNMGMPVLAKVITVYCIEATSITSKKWFRK